MRFVSSVEMAWENIAEHHARPHNTPQPHGQYMSEIDHGDQPT
jgi:hypothetical protein